MNFKKGELVYIKAQLTWGSKTYLEGFATIIGFIGVNDSRDIVEVCLKENEWIRCVYIKEITKLGLYYKMKVRRND